MKINLILCFLTFSLLHFLQAEVKSEEDKTVASKAISCNSVSEYAKEIPPLRGLSFLNEVPCKLHTKEEVQEYLLGKINKEDMAEKLNKEEIIFKAIGMIPHDFSYKEGLVELYTDQVGGFYEPDGKYYAFASWLPGSMQGAIAVHELTHAIQDQHFDLQKMMDDSLMSDMLLARSALVEGDATLVMTDFTRKPFGMPRLKDEVSVSSTMLQTILGATFGGSIKKAPGALQSMILFPYISGLKFAHALIREGGNELLNKALKNPPRSSSEILHPEKYLRNLKNGWKENKLSCKMPLDHTNHDPELIHEDILGEFGISAHFIAHGRSTIAPEIAPFWVEDRVCLYKYSDKTKKGNENPANEFYLKWDHLWESEKASDFFVKEVKDQWAKRLGVISNESENASITKVGNFGIESYRILKEAHSPSSEVNVTDYKTVIEVWIGQK
ncbi:MAG TPA: hypothetical protein PKA63_06475 [Oligoflexia bacterium]|nr:hypothetical protein [Oligoflexia bacterium]HMP48294.1 hypothetical protein [Oligoflexia bacterium]